MKTRLSIVALVAAGALISGCGSSSNNSSGGTTTTPPTSDTTATSSSHTHSGGGGGSDPGSAYCTDLKSIKDEFESNQIAQLSQATFDEVRSKAGQIESEAPSDVQADWKTVVDKLDQLQSILNNAGLNFDDLAALEQGKKPKGLTKADLIKLGHDLQTFAKDKSFEKATKKIDANVKSVCGLNMGS